MKRCIICGAVGDDNSTKCDVCGNPFIDTTNSAVSGTSEAAQEAGNLDTDAAGSREPQTDMGSPENHAEAVQPEAAGAPEAGEMAAAPQRQPQRRMRSGPHIYGQADEGANAPDYARQGMVRRNVQGRPAGSAPRRAPMNRPVQGNPSGRDAGAMNQAQRPVNRPVNPMQGQQVRPASPMSGPMNRPVSQPQPMGTRPVMSAGYMSSQIEDTAKKMFKSPFFLLIAILHTAYFVGGIVAIILRQTNYSQIVRLIEGIDLPSQISGYVGSFVSILSILDNGAFAANFALHLPELVFCIGLWMVYIMAVTSREKMSGIGFTLMKVTVLINMIVSCIVMAVILIVAVAVVIASWVAGAIPVVVMSVSTLVLVIVVVMMVIMYQFCFLATIKTCRLNGCEGESYGSVSGYVAVIHIILGLTGIVNLLSGIVNSEPANIIGAVGKIGWMILFASWIFMYKGKMEEFE